MNLFENKSHQQERLKLCF